jgi:hypothetical protein
VTLGVNRQSARPAGSDAYVQAREAQVSEWSAGKIVRVTVYTDVDEARAAAMRLAQARARE